jgi:uncharacterized membrane protein (UPF0127 family)
MAVNGMRRAAVLALMMMPAGALACPNVGLARETVAFETGSGRHSYTVEKADTPEQQSCGLMFRESMPRDVGMIFPMRPARVTAFWMRNTPLPLDIIFVGPDDRVVAVGQGKPFSDALVPSGRLTATVVELNAGEAARIGLKPGDRLRRGKPGKAG